MVQIIINWMQVTKQQINMRSRYIVFLWHYIFVWLRISYYLTFTYVFFVRKDALGKSLEEICKIVPGGSLIFFPSYKLMEKLCNRWRKTGQWSRLNARKPLFVGNTYFVPFLDCCWAIVNFLVRNCYLKLCFYAYLARPLY